MDNSCKLATCNQLGWFGSYLFRGIPSNIWLGVTTCGLPAIEATASVRSGVALLPVLLLFIHGSTSPVASAAAASTTVAAAPRCCDGLLCLVRVLRLLLWLRALM